MEWYEWLFDGIGTALISAIFSLIAYNAAIKNIGKQSQTAGDGSNQKQEMVIEDSGEHENVQSTIKQTQKSGKNSKQMQVGKINDRK
ncbi:hypothetical protein J6Z19_00530 [bacterium]|nr:hypothetical protein [bacterium]